MNTDDKPADPGPEAPQDAPQSATGSDSNEVDRRVLELLVCPLTKTTLHYNAATGELISRAANLAFPIRNGVPLMIEDAARPLTDDDLSPRPAKPQS